MTTIKTIKPPVWFWVASIIALLWNLMGVGSYLYDAYEKDAVMATFTEAQQSIFVDQPAWVTGAYALAVFGGVLGCIGLLLRKKWAKSLFWISILAVIARTGYYFFMTDATEVFGMLEGTILPILVLIIAGLLIILTKIGSDRYWLK